MGFRGMEPDHWGDTGTEKEESEAIRTKILIDLHHKCWIKVKLHNLFHLLSFQGSRFWRLISWKVNFTVQVLDISKLLWRHKNKQEKPRHESGPLIGGGGETSLSGRMGGFVSLVGGGAIVGLPTVTGGGRAWPRPLAVWPAWLKYKYTHVQIHKYKYSNTNSQIDK